MASTRSGSKHDHVRTVRSTTRTRVKHLKHQLGSKTVSTSADGRTKRVAQTRAALHLRHMPPVSVEHPRALQLSGQGAAEHESLSVVEALPVPFEFTNLDKPVLADASERPIIKAEVIAYYASVAELMLPHVQHRPLTLVRWPEGHGTHCYVQRHAHANTPEAVQRVPIREAHKRAECMLVRDVSGIIALAQLATLEIHTWCCRAPQIARPDRLVLGVHAEHEQPWDAVIVAAVELRQRLTDVGLDSFVHLTGDGGLQVVTPLKVRLTWPEQRQVARAVVDSMAKDAPDRYLVQSRKGRAQDRVVLDASPSGWGATAVAPYSLRALPGAPVAAPITWDELMAGARTGDFALHGIAKRIVPGAPDPWAGFREVEQALSRKALRSLGCV
jgi:bifunctional non-homologous end joining protein LigD